MRFGSPPKTSSAKIAELAREVGLAGRHQLCRSPEMFATQIRHAGRQYHRHRKSSCRNIRRRIRRPARSENVTPFWMRRRRRRRGRSRYRDRPFQHHQAGQRGRRRQADQSEARGKRSFPAPRIMQLGFTMSEEMIFDDGQVTNAFARRLQDPGIARCSGRFMNEHVELEAARRSVRRQRRRRSHDVLRCRRRSPTRSTTRSAFASPIAAHAGAVFRALRAAQGRSTESDMTACAAYRFTLNGPPVTADVEPHESLVELLQYASICAARAKAAARACAAAAPSWSTASRFGLSLSRSVSPTAPRWQRSRARVATSSIRCSRPSSRPGFPMRLLHARASS